MPLKIVVIGGTGLIGSQLITLLTEKGHAALPASPRSGVNTLTGEGLAPALEGADIVVDVSNSPSFEATAVRTFFETSTRNLLAAAAAAGVAHYVALSVVGTDRLADSGYFRAKMAQEALIRAGAIPYSIVRATQFFEFVSAIADSTVSGSQLRVPSVLFQPIASADVAAAVCEVVLGAPLNGIVDIAGPERYRMDEVIRLNLRQRQDAREVLADPQARYFDAAVAEDSLVPTGPARLGGLPYEDWLHS